jgi:hypothetical protein
MHRGVTAHLKAGRYCAAIESALGWLNCTSYPQLAQELAGLGRDEREPLLALLRDALLLGGPLGGPLWGVPILLRYDSPAGREGIFMPPTTLAAGVARVGWLSVAVLESDEPLGFACKPASLGLPSGVVSGAVLVVQTDDTEPPELADDCVAEAMSIAPRGRVLLSAGLVLPWIDALEAARTMLDGFLSKAPLAAGMPLPLPGAAGKAAAPVFLPASAAANALGAGRAFAQKAFTRNSR